MSSPDGRRSDYYDLTVPAGQVISIQTSGALGGIVGIRTDEVRDAFTHSWPSTAVGGSMRLVSDGRTVQVYATGADSTSVGDYTLVVAQQALVHSCDTGTHLMVGVRVAQSLTAANSCTVNIKYSPNPAAVGKPILTHYYGARLVAGLTYTVTIDGLSTAFNPGLTVFHNGSVHAQSVQELPASRSVVIRPTTTGLFVIELSSGMFGPTGNWVTPSGNYTLSITRS